MASLAAAAALAPAYVLRRHVGFYPTTALEIAILATLAVFAVESAVRRRLPEVRSPLLLPAAVFLLAGLVSVFDAPSITAAAGIYRAYFVEPLLAAVAILTAVRSQRQALAVLAGFCAGAAVLGVANSAAVVLAVQRHTFVASAPPPVAIYPVGNMVALYLVPLVAMTAAIAVHGRERWARLLFGVLAICLGAAATLTLSRGGWAALVAVAAGLALSTRRRWLWLGLLAAGLAGLLLVPPIGQRLAAELRSGSSQTYNGRTDLWSATLRMLARHPVLGAGLSGFVTRILEVDRTRYYEVYPHNIFLNFWSETGLLGLGSFGALTVTMARVAWRGFRRGREGWRALNLGVLLALVAILVHGMVDVPFFKNDLSFQFWAIAGLLAAAHAWGSDSGSAVGLGSNPGTGQESRGKELA